MPEVICMPLIAIHVPRVTPIRAAGAFSTNGEMRSHRFTARVVKDGVASLAEPAS
jgi:hypothetical protein